MKLYVFLTVDDGLKDEVAVFDSAAKAEAHARKWVEELAERYGETVPEEDDDLAEWLDEFSLSYWIEECEAQ